jgi:hypothetical protein
MKQVFSLLLVALLVILPHRGFCKSQEGFLEKQLFDNANSLFRISRGLAALKEDLVAHYAENPTDMKWSRVKTAVNKLVLSHRVSFLTSLSIRGIGIVRTGSKTVWCEGQKAVVAASIKWAEKDLKGLKKILGQVENTEITQMMQKGSAKIEEALVVYRQCNDILDALMEAN